MWCSIKQQHTSPIDDLHVLRMRLTFGAKTTLRCATQAYSGTSHHGAVKTLVEGPHLRIMVGHYRRRLHHRQSRVYSHWSSQVRRLTRHRNRASDPKCRLRAQRTRKQAPRVRLRSTISKSCSVPEPSWRSTSSPRKSDLSVSLTRQAQS